MTKDNTKQHELHAGMADQVWSVRMADSAIKRNRVVSDRWHYEAGVILSGIRQVWLKTSQSQYYDYIKASLDELVDHEGTIRTYRLEEYNLDQINEGKLLFFLYDQSGDERYIKAARLLREQLRTQPRTSQGGFWHKQIYPHQMWLDGIYMACPFYAEFARRFDEPRSFDDIALQISLIEKHTREPKSGLLYHAWDSSKSQAWADPKTGRSPHFWGRAMGWYAMAIPDVLDHFPQDHPERGKLISIFQRLAAAITAVQDESSGVWYQILDQAGRDGNYLEASVSCMFVYALAKGVRCGYLDRKYLDVARRGYKGILEQFVRVDEAGLVNLERICSVGGLGGQPYRDGSFEYYISEKIMANDYKGVGAFVLASIEVEMSQ
ncbi:MAG: glycoside hydrolase family 88 protein [Thermoflexales bacterium]|nr:glycoside hydrolase family 88 protein [Thermoflexales bacterium]